MPRERGKLRTVDINIRTALPSDWAICRDLRLLALADDPAAFRSTLENEESQSDEWWEERIRQTVEHPHRELWISEVDGEPKGTLLGIYDPDTGVMRATALWVAVEARGIGVAGELLERALNWGRDAGAREAEIWVNQGNTMARRLYRRAGFQPTIDTQPLRPGSPHITTRMARRL